MTGARRTKDVLMLSALGGASLAAIVLCSAASAGGPTGGVVVSGQASIASPNANKTVVTQSSTSALINWNNFSISAGSSVIFDQPNASALTVNRVTGPEASIIDGALLANGRIWILNGNGILFGHGSEINVGSLLATTSDISNENYLNGQYVFTPSAHANASVVNQGTIAAARGGSIVLSAPTVANQGVISADLGTVQLGGAQAFALDLNGDNLLRYQISVPSASVQSNTQGVATSVTNTGTISAQGGRIFLTARAAQDVQESVINNTGVIEATSVTTHNGQIELDAGPNGTVDVGGEVDASGMGRGQSGGWISVTGSAVDVNSGAVISASGQNGGGTILIGGGFHGFGPISDASTTTVGNATITADATVKGNGGSIAIWSNQNTTFNGTISAKGGQEYGSGGYVETSGAQLGLGESAYVNTSAAHGSKGTWLLDPLNIVIQTGGSTPLTSGTLSLTTDSGLTDTVDPSTITSAILSNNVELEAANNITVNSNVIYSSANSLTMLAGGNIDIYATVQNTMASGGGAINLVAGWDESTRPPSSLTGSTVYGNNGGSVVVGATGASGNASIGSMSGATLVEGYDVTVQSDNGIAQIGYAGAATGNITVLAQDDIIVDTDDIGSGNLSYAQIGNGGYNVAGAIGGNITVDAGTGTNGGTLTIEGDVDCDTCVQAGIATIGNLGGANSSESGNITVTVGAGTVEAGDLNITSSEGSEFASIGNQATAPTTGSATGTIQINSGPVSLLSDASSFSDAWIGNGGEINGFDNGDGTGGDIDIYATSVSVIANYADNSDRARISDVGTGNVTGNILIETTGDVSLSSNDGNLTAIGLGEGCTQPCSGETDGNITIETGNAASLSVQAVGGGEARIGSDTATSSSSVDVTAGSILLSLAGTNNSGTLPEANIGSVNNAGNGGGDVTVTTTNGDITLDAAETDAVVNIGPQGGGTSGTTLGNVNVIASGNIFLYASGTGSLAQIGPSNQGFVTTGDTTVTAGSTITLTTGAYIGEIVLPESTAGTISGDVTINAVNLSGDISPTMANDVNYGGFALTLTGTQPLVIDTPMSFSTSGAISLSNGGDVMIESSIQNAGNGNISIMSPGTVTIGGSGAETDVAVGSFGGTTTVTTANLNVEADNGIAQLGYESTGGGNIVVNATDDVTVNALTNSYAQIGNGGFDAEGAISGNITITAGGNLNLDETEECGECFGLAAIGNVGGSSESGEIQVNVTGSLNIYSSAGDGFAQIGNLATGFGNGSATGDITITSGALTVLANSSDFSVAMIGDGGLIGGADNGNGTGGNINITAAAVDVSASGVGSNSEAFIGNTGAGNVSGNITINSAGYVAISAVDGNVAGIGLGEDCSQPCSGMTSGNITVTSGGGFLSMSAQGGGAAFIGSGPAATGSTIDVTAVGDIVLALSGTNNSGGAANVTIGNIVGNNQSGNDVTVTSTGGTIDLESGVTNGSVSIGPFAGNYGNIFDSTDEGNTAVSAPDATNGNIILDVTATGALALIGTETDFTSAISNTTVIAGNTITLTGGAYIGEYAEPGAATGTRTGDVSITAQTLSGDISPILVNDVAYGGFTLDLTGTQPLVIDLPVSYASASNVSLTNGGDITLDESIQNAGTGNLSITSGGTVTIGGLSTEDNVSVGSMGGTTSVTTNNLVVESDGGIAQLGYAGAGTGDINVNATGNVIVQSLTYDYAQIGNGGNSVSGNIGGNITIQAGGNLTVLESTYCNGCVDLAVAAIGNIGGANSSESGNIAINAGGALAVDASGFGSLAQIGNLALAPTSGGALGNITIGSGSVSVVASAPGLAVIGDGGYNVLHAAGVTPYTNSGTSGGNISITTGDLAIDANVPLDQDAAFVSSIGNGSIVGNVTINASGSIALFADDGNFAAIGIGETCPSMCEYFTSTGNVSVQAGGQLSITAFGGGEAGIENNNDVPTSTVSVVAGGDITLLATGTDIAGTAPYAFIGVNQGPFSGGGSVSVISTSGSISLSADESTAYVAIAGGCNCDAPGITDENSVSVSAPNATNGSIFLSAIPGALVQIGPGDNGGTVTGNTTVTAGNEISIPTGESVVIGPDIFAGVGTISGNVSISAQTISGDISPIMAADVAYGGFSLDLTGTQPLVIDAALNLSGASNLSLSNGGDITVEDSILNSGTGNIAITSGGTVMIGGGSAPGNVAVGTSGGTTSISANSLMLVADNGYAQVGYIGGGTGDIDVTTAADISLEGGAQTGYFAQIGNGGYLTNGSNGGNISITSAGDIDLSAGAGSFAYAQIGNGGALSNEASNGYSNTGAITVLAADVVLDSGSGTASYSQIGNGGFEAGVGLLGGTATNSGDISVTSETGVALQGGSAADTYSQIGNGGDQVNANAAKASSGAISGNIAVLAQNGSVSLMAGAGTHAYVQIGNGGYAENAPNALPANFTVSGSVTVSDLTLAGGNGGADSYAQIGNGDDASSGIADISGDIVVEPGAGLSLSNGTAVDSLAFIGNATGIGTVSGTVQGIVTPPVVSTADNSDQTAQENDTNNTDLVQSIEAVEYAPIPDSLAGSNGANYPLALVAMSGLSDANPYPEGQDVSDQLLANIGNSLDAGSKSTAPAETIDLIPGLLKEVIGPEPDAIPPPDKSFSSWGNERLWQ